MKLFAKNFRTNKNDKQNIKQWNIEKTSEMLDETIFWMIVDSSVKSSSTRDQQEEFLVKEIMKLSPKQMIGFRLRTDGFLSETYNSKTWCAGYIMNAGCSDDGFEYFRNWIISRGKEAFYRAKENPDQLISEHIDGKGYYLFESFWYVALTAFKNKTGKQLYDFIHPEFNKCEVKYPNFEFTWNEENPETLRSICPNLFDKLWY